MADKAKSSRRASTSAFAPASSAPAKSPDSDVSPRAQFSQPATQSGDYFSTRRDSGSKKNTGSQQGGVKFASLPTPTSRSAQIFDQNSANFHRGSVASSSSPGTTAQSPGEQSEEPSSRRASDALSTGFPESLSRKSSVASVSFRQPQDPKLPQGEPKKTDGKRLRASSPNPVKFKRHVGFDNLPAGEATKFNTQSLTLNDRHQGYHPRRRSRTFMVGVDEHAYSDYALVWLLENLVDDGDEVVCVRVVEGSVKGGDKSYQEEAKKMMASITAKNTHNRAISIVLEYSVGKLHATFQQLIQMYQPSMLIVGTRGRSLGGIQGLVNNRNSFSKYCLQYSPVPVVVVRPDEKRRKKKDKRSHDPSRQSYLSMLSSNEGVHEADKGASGLYETETQLRPEEEAHEVAAAIGLPAAFDPTIKPLQTPLTTVNPRSSASSVLGSSVSTTAEVPLALRERRSSTPPPLRATNTNDESGDDDSDDDEGGFDVTSGQDALKIRERLEEQAQKERLHRMEVGEAKALLTSGGKITEEDEEEEEDETSSQGSGDQARRRSA